MITVQTPKKNVVDDETVMGMYPDPNSETNANKSALAVVQAQSALPREAVVTAWLLQAETPHEWRGCHRHRWALWATISVSTSCRLVAQ
jgi:hypothetical protein